LVDAGIDGRIILKLIVKKYGLNMRVGFIWLKAVLVMGCYEQGHELSGSIKGREFLVYLSNFQLLKKDSAPLSQNTYVS
jgi:hypothetical protein